MYELYINKYHPSKGIYRGSNYLQLWKGNLLKLAFSGISVLF